MFELPVTGSEPCAQVDPEIFFEESGPQALVNLPKLKSICSGCPILEQCREHGIKHEEYGFWGGLTAVERKRMRRQRGVPLVSVTVWNQRTITARTNDLRKREQDDMRRLPTRSDLKWRVAQGNKGGTKTA